MHADADAAARDERFERQVLGRLPEVARFARSLTRDAADADDLVQETVLRAYRFYHTFRHGDDPRRWLLTICRNVFRRRMRRTTTLADPVDLVDAEAESLAAARGHAAMRRDGEDALLDYIDVGPAIDRALRALPETYRGAVVLVDMEGFSYEEAARVERVPVGTVRSRLFRGRRLLQEALLAHARDVGLGAGRSLHLAPPGGTPSQ